MNRIINSLYPTTWRTLRMGLATIAGIVVTTACSDIDREDRLSEVGPIAIDQISKSVLIEDFTGQRCSNCPTATLVMESLTATYGDAVIPVGIHSGPLGGGTPLYTETGQHYFELLGDPSLGQPSVRVNRSGEILTGASPIQSSLANRVVDELTAETPVEIKAQLSMEGTSSVEPTTLAVALTADAHGAFAQAQLQLWVLEDGITSYQVIEDGSRDRSYVHNHVFRASITANPDGEPVKLDGSEVSYSLPIDEKWNAENLSVVIIVSDPATGTVLQAHKVAINN